MDYPLEKKSQIVKRKHSSVQYIFEKYGKTKSIQNLQLITTIRIKYQSQTCNLTINSL